jgi:molecular chaperone GrpE
MKKEQEAATKSAADKDSEEMKEEMKEETPVAADDAGEEQASSENLTLMLEDARSKADEHWNNLVRAKAEIDNLRKRHERDLENAHKYALERFVAELLAVRDSMELGLSAAQEQGADVEKLLEGTELTLKLFSDVMERFDVVQVDPQGEPFDPDLHQAMSMQPRDDVAPNTVVTVVQKGYTLNGRLVRPAMVIVSQAAATD